MTDLVVGNWGDGRGLRPHGASRIEWARGASAMILACLAGCAGTGDAPPPFDERQAAQAVFLVHDELFSIRLDGTDRRSLGIVGDNKWRTGWPRRLPDGRAAVLGDDAGAIFPYYEMGGRILRLSGENVTLNDSLCGVTVGGEPRMVITTTPFVPTRTAVQRVNLDDPAPELMHLERFGLIAHPAPYADGQVVAARYSPAGTQIVVLDVARSRATSSAPQALAFVDPPYFGASPARLADGRVIFLRLDSRQDTDLQPGDVWIVEADGTTRPVGLDGVINLIVIGDRVVYETVGPHGFTDVMASNLVDPPVNVTATPYVSEHLGWSD